MDYLPIIKKPIISEFEEFSSCLRDSLRSTNPLLQSVIDHIMQKNGKMMRPMLLLLVSKLLGKPSPVTYHAAVSLELLHNASLVHDDIVDESRQRRGQLSVNARFNNKVAVLSGDFLLATSLVEVSKTYNHEIIEVISKLGQDLADGELLQLSNVSNNSFSEEVYFDVIRKKTAVLFAACCQAAALSVGASAEQVAKARLLGEYIGICFQIKDDIFDYFDANIGKPTGNDMQEGKLTLPVLYVLNNTHDDVARTIALRVKEGGADEDDIDYLVKYTINNGGIEYAESVMMMYRDRALELFANTDNSDVAAALEAYIDFVVKRKL